MKKMALWQFHLALIPQSWLEAVENIESLFSDEGYDTSSAWASHDSQALEATLGSVLPRGKSWSPALTVWGSSETNDIRLWRSGSAVTSVDVRFDLRNPNMALFKAVIGIARQLQLAILVPSLRRTIGSDVDLLLRAAGESDAAHFVLDPLSFLSQLDAANARAT